MSGLSLEAIASRLAALEETLIYKLLDRAQFAHNADAYSPTKSGFHPAEAASLFELRLRAQEILDAPFGRYLIPEERPFHRGLPEPRRVPAQADTGLTIRDLETVNVTASIRTGYINSLESWCGPGDDGQWGSSVEHDVICLQAVSRRIHFGALYVGESKYREAPEQYRTWVEACDDAAIEKAITRPAQEVRVLERVRTKVTAIQSISDPSLRRLVDPEVVMALFRTLIIPLTKEGEVRYLYQRSTGREAT